MELIDAITLISNNFISNSGKQHWADLGCGTGLFTRALAHLLPDQSIIYAIDNDSAAIDKIPTYYEGVEIEKQASDFTKVTLPSTSLDGILMANALHYIQDQVSLITSLANFLKSDHCLLFVEYNTDKPNPWVPYPLSFQSLQKLAKITGYTSVEKLQEKASIYGRADLYTALLKKGSY